MRVLMISLDRGLLGAAGSGDVLERHKKYADLAGHLDVIVFAGPKYSENMIAPNLRIFSTRSSKFAHFHRASDIAKELIKEQAYDLLVTQEFTAPVGLRIKKFFNLPWIVNIHSMFFSSRWLGFNPIYWYMLFLIKKAIRKADGFRVNNNEIRDKLVSWGVIKPILIQPTPIDISSFFPKREPYPKAEGQRIRVLFVGRLVAEKNLHMLIMAVRKLRNLDFSLDIVGRGPEEQNLKRLAADDLRINFLGVKSTNELPEIFQASDIFILPSNTESYGQVLLQAAAAGCAIIATATAGAKTILGDSESGVLIPMGSQKDLEKALGNFVSKRFEREYWSKKAREMADRYDASVGVQRTIDLWKEVAAK